MYLREFDGCGHYKTILISSKGRALYEEIGKLTNFKAKISRIVLYQMLVYDIYIKSLRQIWWLICWPLSLLNYIFSWNNIFERCHKVKCSYDFIVVVLVTWAWLPPMVMILYLIGCTRETALAKSPASYATRASHSGTPTSLLIFWLSPFSVPL